jgi:hypothetical protein
MNKMVDFRKNFKGVESPDTFRISITLKSVGCEPYNFIQVKDSIVITKTCGNGSITSTSQSVKYINQILNSDLSSER